MKYIPNTITIIRILLTPVLLILLLSNTMMGQFWALVLFIIASISDYLDGKLARHYQVPSRLGQFLDPFADKVLVLGTFTALIFVIPDIVPWWGVVLIALRDLMVTGLRTWAEANGRSIRTLPAAKLKTTVQLTFLISTLLVIFAANLPGQIGEMAQWYLDSPIPFILMIIVVVVTLWTGVLYFTRMEYSSPAEQNG